MSPQAISNLLWVLVLIVFPLMYMLWDFRRTLKFERHVEEALQLVNGDNDASTHGMP